MFIATIHDCLVTTEGDDAVYARDVMWDEFAKLGVRPGLKVETFGRPL